MLNKRVLLGTLVAGAMLLPMTASAGVVSGACVNCHTMHQTDGSGGARAGGGVLLAGNSCEGCHAVPGVQNTAGAGTGDAGGFQAPQVDSNLQPNLAGYFTRADVDQQQHNVVASIPGVTVDDAMPAAPGSNPAGRLNTTCEGCHTLSSGGHHGDGGTVYRMLFAASTDMSGDALYGSSTASGEVDVSRTTYDSDQMNDVCKICHSDFHTGQLSAGAWIRHPTDVDLTSLGATMSAYNYDTNYNSADQNIVPTGTSSSVLVGGVGTRTVMCISCHFSHGSGNDNLLRFAYDAANNVAGGATPVRSDGCESCHSYTDVNGQAGM